MAMDEPVDFQSFIHSYRSGLLVAHATSAAPVTRLYLISHPVPGNISAIKISIVSHNEGSKSTDAEISNTWFDATILRPRVSAGDKGKSQLPSAPIVPSTMGCSEIHDLWWTFNERNWFLFNVVHGDGVFRICANSISSEWQTHEVLWNAGAPSDTDKNSGTSFIDRLTEGDRIAIWARAKNVNRKNFVQHVRIEMTLAEPRRIGLREWLPHRYDPERAPDLDENKTFFGSIGIPLDDYLSDEEVFEKHGFRWSIEKYKTWSQHHISAEPSDPCEFCGLRLSYYFYACMKCQKGVRYYCRAKGTMNNHLLTERLVFNQDVKQSVKDGGGVEDATSTTARRLRNENYVHYRPLDGGTKEIRLLSIMPSQNDDEPLSCFLTNGIISEGSYVALSYCWGDMKKQKGITVCHASKVSEHTFILGPFHALRVTENLFNALKNIRKTLRMTCECSQNVTFWVDALCINQGDNEERAQQVGLMDQIYANARQVWVWIGDSEETQSAMRSIGLFRIKAHQYFERIINQDLGEIWRDDSILTKAFVLVDRNLSHYMFRDICIELEKEAERCYSNFERFLLDFSHVMDQPWFERIWVLQEVFCARSSVHFYAGLTNLVKFSIVMLGNHYSNFHRSISESFRANRGRLLEDWGDLFGISHQRNIGRSGDGGMMTLINLFRHTVHTFDATDPRDKLFALLGLVREKSQLASPSYPSVPKTPIVDYTKPVSDVFCDFTLCCIENYRNLDVLSVVGEKNCHFPPSYRSPTSSQEYDKDLPSWVLWHNGKPPELCGKLALESQHFDASGKRYVDITALRSNSRSTLTLKGVRVGIVESVSLGALRTKNEHGNSELFDTEFYMFDYRTYDLLQFRMNVLWDMASSGRAKMEGMPTYDWLGHTESAYKGDREAMFRDFLETIMLRFPEPGSGNIWAAEDISHRLALYWKRHDPEFRQLPPSVRDFTEPLATKDATWQSYDDFVSLVPIQGKKLFMSDEWRLGLCPAETEAGDVIVVLFGGKVPFILRPKQSAPLPGYMGGQEWEFIGECFVHGRMHSGVVDEKLQQNVPIENFHLV